MSSLAYCYQYPGSQYPGSTASQQNTQTSPQSSNEVQYARHNPSPGGFSPSTHRRSHSLSATHPSYDPEYLFPERQSRWNDAREELGLTRTLSQSRSPVRGGKIRMPIVEPSSYDDGWVMPTRNHFVPLPAPEEHQREGHSHRRRYSTASPVPSDGEWASSASRSTSPCSIASSRRSSRSSEKRVRFAE